MTRSAPATFAWNRNVIALLVMGSNRWFGLSSVVTPSTLSETNCNPNSSKAQTGLTKCHQRNRLLVIRRLSQAPSLLQNDSTKCESDLKGARKKWPPVAQPGLPVLRRRCNCTDSDRQRNNCVKNQNRQTKL